ncbi:MAG: restriction endonuclease subunit S [Methylobacter sp.]|nr:restriction endonuclease subunit S [Methylobacter sp.]
MNVPQLRFKEFNGEWKSLHLGQITETITSGSRNWAQYYSKNGSKFIRMTNLSRDGIQLKLDDLKFVNIKSNSIDGNRTSLAHGDILISITAELGKIGWIPPSFGEAFINQHTALVRIKKATTESKFIAYLLSTTKLNIQINRMNDAGAKAGLNLPTIKSIKIQLPGLEEQTKIANFLTAVDEKIAQLTQKGELLARYKKGMMQQIFSQQLRFKDDDGREFPDWKHKTLGEICSIKRGASPRPIADKKWFSEDSKIGWVRISDVSRSDKYLNRTQQYLSDEGIEKSRLVKKGNIIMSICATIGKPIYTNFDVCIHDGFVVFDSLQIKHEFLYYYLMLIEKNWYQYGQPGSQVNLNSDIVSNESINIPDEKEQTKIANFLTALDDKISHNQIQLKTMKQYKQGLLQQLFV